LIIKCKEFKISIKAQNTISFDPWKIFVYIFCFMFYSKFKTWHITLRYLI